MQVEDILHSLKGPSVCNQPESVSWCGRNVSGDVYVVHAELYTDTKFEQVCTYAR